MTAHVFHQNVLKEVSSGPSVYAYSSTAPASAPWVRVTEIQVRNSGLWKPAWTLSDPLTLTFDATAANSFLCQKFQNDSQGSTIPYTVPASYEIDDWDNATRWKTSTSWDATSSTKGLGANSIACGHAPKTDRWNSAHVGVMGNFVNSTAGEAYGTPLKTRIEEALVTRPVIKSATITMQRRYNSAEAALFNSLNIPSGTNIYAVLYKDIVNGTPRYSKLDTTTTYRGMGSVAAYDANNAIMTITYSASAAANILTALNSNLVVGSTTTSAWSIGIVATISSVAQYLSINNTSPDSSRCDSRGPLTASSAGSKPTLTVVLDYT